MIRLTPAEERLHNRVAELETVVAQLRAVLVDSVETVLALVKHSALSEDDVEALIKEVRA